MIVGALRLANARGLSRGAGPHRRLSRPLARTHLALAGRHGRRRASSLRCQPQLGVLAAQRRFLRRRLADLARCGHPHSAANRTARNRWTISAGGFTDRPIQGPRLCPTRSTTSIAALNDVLPYDWRGFFQHAGLRNQSAPAARRHRKRRLAARLQRSGERRGPRSRHRGRYRCDSASLWE